MLTLNEVGPPLSSFCEKKILRNLRTGAWVNLLKESVAF